jgi:hypothetical protein
MLQNGYRIVAKIVKNYVKSPFGIDCPVGLKYTRVLLITVISTVWCCSVRRSLSCWIVCFAGVVTFCETAFIILPVIIIIIDFASLLANSPMALFPVHQATKYP